jgi:hypothetical protein
VLRADLVTELKQWIVDTGRSGSDALFDMPSPSQLCKVLRKDLAHAGVPLQPFASSRLRRARSPEGRGETC